MNRTVFIALLVSATLIVREQSATADEYDNIVEAENIVLEAPSCAGLELGEQAGEEDCETCRDWGVCDSSCGTGGYFAAVELMMFKYYRSDGARVGTFSLVGNDDVVFDHKASPRLTVGYVTDSGIGGRLRYWEFAHSAFGVFPAAGAFMTVDTYNVDFELFERFQVSDCWDFEVSAGLRYNEFDETMIDGFPPAVRLNSFTGWGGILGLEGVRRLGVFGNLYSRARFGILQDDHFVQNDQGVAAPFQSVVLTDSTNMMTELAFGYERTRETSSGALLFGRIGYEWQHWTNYSSAFWPVVAPPVTPAFAGQSDVGFSGLAFALGVER